MSLFAFGFKKIPEKLDCDGGVITEGIPDVPRRAISSANKLVSKVKAKKGKRGKYKRSNAEYRLRVAEYARINCLAAATNNYSVPKSTISGWRDKYCKVMGELGMY